MTRTFRKKKIRLKKKRFWSKTEALTDSGSAKGDSATNSIHPAIHNLPQKGKKLGYTRLCAVNPRVYAEIPEEPMCIRDCK